MFIVFMCSQIVFIAEGFYTSTTLVSVTLVIKRHHLMTVETLLLFSYLLIRRQFEGFEPG